MKYLNQLMTLCATAFLFASCKKDEVKTSPLTSITMVNAVMGGTTAKLGSNATSISNNSSAQMAVVAGDNNLYVWPVGDSLHPYYANPKLTTQDREVYSLFLTGTPAAPEGILVKENIPYRTDSTAGIRFINLAPNSTPLNITLATSTATNEIANLAYKGITEFKTYPGLYNSSYAFQVRAANNPGTVITTFSLSSSTVPRFANITLVIRQNGTGLSVYRVNNDR
jgi:hypothetical protein